MNVEIRRSDKITNSFVRILFKKFEDKDKLRVFIESFPFLSGREKELMIYIYCDNMPIKCAAFKMNMSKRWTDTLHSKCVCKSAPYVFALILKGLNAAL